ncbi:MAG: preprotein translocase subunit SecY [Deltaproteobacteria bacterium]|nr:preprotein translocase subunit SecY [Deltaproteobacteria bacterium]
MSTSLGNITKIPELKKRILFTLMMLAVYRLGCFIPTPGIDPVALKKFLSQGTIFEIINLFSGGAFEKFSVFALSIMPYISASIIMQLLTVVIPSLEKLQKEGEQGRKKITQYTRYGTVVLALVQGFGFSYGLERQGVLLPGEGGILFCFTSMFTLAAGTSFVMWLGEQITERGIGNGISLVIFSGIVARIPSAFRDALKTQTGFTCLLLLGFIAVVIALIAFCERGQRRIPISFAKRVVGRKMFGGQTTHLPLKINTAGVIPPIFASSLILFPATIAQFFHVEFFQRIATSLTSGWLHTFLYVFLIIFFAFFYTAVAFNPVDVADNVRKNGGFIPGVRPGKPTSDFIDRVLTRITLGGAVYVAAICVLPELLMNHFGIPRTLASVFGGTSILIIVGVAMDTVAQMESHLLSHHYDGFLGQKAGKFKGRRG